MKSKETYWNKIMKIKTTKEHKSSKMLIYWTDLRVEKELEWPAMSEVVLRRPRAGGMTTSSLAVRGTELALVETDSSRSGWSSLRLRRSRLFLCSLKLRPLNRLIRLWETISSKRCLCFLGMKILTNMANSRRSHRGETEHTLKPAETHWMETRKQSCRRRDGYEKVCYNYTRLQRCSYDLLWKEKRIHVMHEAFFFLSCAKGQVKISCLINFKS